MSKRGRRSAGTTAAAVECPVCMGEVTEDDVAAFPCGHVVCRGCDARLLETGHLRCPTCRTVRSGWTESEANLAATTRSLQGTYGDDDDNDNHDYGAGIGSTRRVSAFEIPRSNGRATTHVLFFSNEANGSPFGPLVELSDLVAHGNDLTAPRPNVLQRTTARSSVRIAERDEIRELDDDRGAGIADRRVSAQPPSQTPFPVADDIFAAVVQSLMAPSEVSQFFARRRAAAANAATAAEARQARAGARGRGSAPVQ